MGLKVLQRGGIRFEEILRSGNVVIDVNGPMDEIEMYENGGKTRIVVGLSPRTSSVEVDITGAGPQEPGSKPAAAKAEPEKPHVDSGYAGLSVADLKDELASRELKVGGKKAELVARLEEDDAAKAEPSE